MSQRQSLRRTIAKMSKHDKHLIETSIDQEEKPTRGAFIEAKLLRAIKLTVAREQKRRDDKKRAFSRVLKQEEHKFVPDNNDDIPVAIWEILGHDLPEEPIWGFTCGPGIVIEECTCSKTRLCDFCVDCTF